MLAAVSAATLVVAAVLMLVRRLRATETPAGVAAGEERSRLTPLLIANLPFALCFDVLEVALPALLVTGMHAAPAWSSAVFVTNTVLVIAGQVALVRWTGRWPRTAVMAASGGVLAVSYLGFWAAPAPAAIVAVGVVYTFGEMLYTGSSTALVIANSDSRTLGRALARCGCPPGSASRSRPHCSPRC